MAVREKKERDGQGRFTCMCVRAVPTRLSETVWAWIMKGLALVCSSKPSRLSRLPAGDTRRAMSRASARSGDDSMRLCAVLSSPAGIRLAAQPPPPPPPTGASVATLLVGFALLGWTVDPAGRAPEDAQSMMPRFSGEHRGDLVYHVLRYAKLAQPSAVDPGVFAASLERALRVVGGLALSGESVSDFVSRLAREFGPMKPACAVYEPALASAIVSGSWAYGFAAKIGVRPRPHRQMPWPASSLLRPFVLGAPAPETRVVVAPAPASSLCVAEPSRKRKRREQYSPLTMLRWLDFSQHLCDQSRTAEASRANLVALYPEDGARMFEEAGRRVPSATTLRRFRRRLDAATCLIQRSDAAERTGATHRCIYMDASPSTGYEILGCLIDEFCAGAFHVCGVPRCVVQFVAPGMFQMFQSNTKCGAEGRGGRTASSALSRHAGWADSRHSRPNPSPEAPFRQLVLLVDERQHI